MRGVGEVCEMCMCLVRGGVGGDGGGGVVPATTAYTWWNFQVIQT